MADPWRLEVRSPEGALLELSEVDRVQVQLVDGPITILRGHLPLIGETVSGALRYRTADGSEQTLRLQPGILIVERHRITVLISGPQGGESAAAHLTI